MVLIESYALGHRHQTQRPKADVTTVEDVLTIDNDVAFNALVDWAKIEVNVLCDNRDQAQRLLRANKDFNRIYLKNDGQLLSMQHGSMSFAPPAVKQNQCRLGANQEAILQQLDNEQALLRSELDQAAESTHNDKKARAELKTKHTELKRSSNASRKNYEGMSQRKKQIVTRLYEIQTEMEADEGIGGAIQAVSEQIREVEAQVVAADTGVDVCELCRVCHL